MKGHSFFHDRTKCPSCGYPIDAATHSQGEDIAPAPGDVGVCFRCASILVYDKFGIPGIPEQTELAVYMADPEVKNTVEKIKQFWKRAQ